MLSYWSKEMISVKSFKAIHGMVEKNGLPLVVLGFSETDEGIELYILKKIKMSEEETILEISNSELKSTYRDAMKMNLNLKEDIPIWATNVFFGDKKIDVKSIQENMMDFDQIKATWILGEALRQGWSCELFEESFLNEFRLITVNLVSSEFKEILKETEIRIQRDDIYESYLLEKYLELPIEKTLKNPIIINVENVDSEVPQEIIIHGIELRNLYNEMLVEHFCQKGSILPIIRYEANSDISIDCYTTKYLDSIIKNQSSGIFISIPESKEFGIKGYPIKYSIIKELVNLELEKLEFEIFIVNKRVVLEDLVFKKIR